MYKLETYAIDRVEHDIRPPMRLAITLPVSGTEDICVYVVASAFGLGSSDEAMLKDIASRLYISEGEK